MAGINPPFKVADAIHDCGVMEGALFNDISKSYRMAAEVLDDELLSCMDKTYREPDEDLRS